MSSGLHVVPNAEAGSVTVTCKGGDWSKLIFIGANIPASALPGQMCTTFTLRPKQGKKMIFAITVWHQVIREWIGRIISINWDDKTKIIVACEEHWLPTSDRLPQVIHIQVEITIGDERYSSNPNSPLFVDGNTLCKYAVGDIEEDAVKAVVQKQQEHAEKLAKALALIAALQVTAERKQAMVDQAKTKLETTLETLNVMDEKLVRYNQRFAEFLRVAEELKTVLSNYRFPGKAGRKALQNWKAFMQLR